MTTLAEAVRQGLAQPQKCIAPLWFYDDRGSALFEEITRLPEYYPTRTEHAILERDAEAIAEAVGSPVCVAELGAGSATKTRTLLGALLKRQHKLSFTAIDVSPEALRLAKESILGEFPQIDFMGVEARNRVGIRALEWDANHRRLILFLGSSIGNFEPEQAVRWLNDVTAPMQAGDSFLLGVDRQKDARVLAAAYDDAAGVTAEFNKNVLARINRELGANFDLHAFEHRAVVSENPSRVEMHLVSLRAQHVTIPGVGEFAFSRGETLHTENSYKYTEGMIKRLVEGANLVETHRFEDAEGWFTLVLLRRRG